MKVFSWCLENLATSQIKIYRRITIIPYLIKMFKLLAYMYIKQNLNHLIIDEQYGFRPGKSIVTSSIIFTT